MSFVRVEDVGDRDVLFLHRRHYLVGFGLLDAGVVGALADKEGAADVVHIGQGGAGQKEVAAGLSAVIADAAGKEVNLGLPVGGYGVHQGDEVGGADDVDATGEGFGGKGHSDEGGIAAIAAAEDGDALGGGNAAVDSPPDGVEEVIVHPAAPLEVGGVDEGFAKAGGAAEVDAEDGVAAVGQELKDGIIAPLVPGPRAAMNEESQRQGMGGQAGIVRVGFPGEGVVANQVQAVACREGDRVIFDQGLAGEGVPVGKEELGLPRFAEVAVVTDGAVIEEIGDNPAVISKGAVEDFQVAGGYGGEKVEVGGNRVVQHLPFLAFISKGGGLDGFFSGVSEGVADIGPGGGSQDGGNAGGQVEGFEGGGVAAAAVEEVEGFAGTVEADWGGGQAVIQANGKVGLPLAGGVFLQIFCAAVLGHPHGKAEVEVVIGDEAGKAVIALNQGTLCGGQVNAVNIVKLGVAVVETDQELAGVFGADLLDLGVDVVQRGQVKDGVGFQMDGVKTPVFIAAGVL